MADAFDLDVWTSTLPPGLSRFQDMLRQSLKHAWASTRTLLCGGSFPICVQTAAQLRRIQRGTTRHISFPKLNSIRRIAALRLLTRRFIAGLSLWYTRVVLLNFLQIWSPLSAWQAPGYVLDAPARAQLVDDLICAKGEWPGGHFKVARVFVSCLLQRLLHSANILLIARTAAATHQSLLRWTLNCEWLKLKKIKSYSYEPHAEWHQLRKTLGVTVAS